MSALVPLAFSAALALAGAPSGAAGGTVTFEVKQGGDVKWQSAPCAFELKDAAGTVVAAGADAQAGAQVAAGKYVGVVACPSDEGTVKRSVAVTVRDSDVKVPVALDPGFLLVSVLRFDTPVRADITVFDERDQEVARSKERAVIAVTPGRVKLLAKVLAADGSSSSDGGRPVFATAMATVVARQKTNVTVDTTDGELTVQLLDNGRKASGVAALRAPGQTTRLVELRAGEKTSVPPGTYDLVTQLDDTHDFAEQLTKNVVIAPKRHATKTVQHRTGTLKPVVLVRGKRAPADAKIDVELFQPGNEVAFNTVALGDVVKLAAGPVELRAARKDAPLDDGTQPAARARASVSAGGQKGVTLDVTWAELDVRTTVGKQPRGLEVEVLPVVAGEGGAATAIARKVAGPDGATSFSLSPGKYVVRAILKAPQGPIVTEQRVSLALGSKLASRLNLDLGTAVVQVFEKGVSVPAEVRFYDPKSIKDGKPTKDPVLSAPAGQEALLPPGTYALFVKRRGDEKSYSDAKIVAGRTFERSVEIAPK